MTPGVGLFGFIGSVLDALIGQPASGAPGAEDGDFKWYVRSRADFRCVCPLCAHVEPVGLSRPRPVLRLVP